MKKMRKIINEKKLERISKILKINSEDLKKSQKTDYRYYRYAIMKIERERGSSLNKIGQFFKRKHETVSNAIRQIENLSYLDEIKQVEEAVRNAYKQVEEADETN